jgi:ProP effector
VIEHAAANDNPAMTATLNSMNSHPSDAPEAIPDPTVDSVPPSPKKRELPPVQPVLEKLFELYPALFGAQFLPLKLGVFQELLTLHPDHFQRDTLKAALGVHTRSTRYLQSVAAGLARHDLHGVAGDAVAPEHVYLAILELHRRRQIRAREDLTPQLRKQVKAAFDASGLSAQDYLARLLITPEDAHPVLQDVLAEAAQQVARREATFKAFESSGKTAAEFADMYGMQVQDVELAIKAHRQP